MSSGCLLWLGVGSGANGLCRFHSGVLCAVRLLHHLRVPQSCGTTSLPLCLYLLASLFLCLSLLSRSLSHTLVFSQIIALAGPINWWPFVSKLPSTTTARSIVNVQEKQPAAHTLALSPDSGLEMQKTTPSGQNGENENTHKVDESKKGAEVSLAVGAVTTMTTQTQATSLDASPLQTQRGDRDSPATPPAIEGAKEVALTVQHSHSAHTPTNAGAGTEQTQQTQSYSPQQQQDAISSRGHRGSIKLAPITSPKAEDRVSITAQSHSQSESTVAGIPIVPAGHSSSISTPQLAGLQEDSATVPGSVVFHASPQDI